MSLRTEIKFGFVNRFVAALTRPSNATSHGFRDRPAHIYSFTSSRPASAARRHSSLHEFQHPSTTANHAWPSSRCPFPSLPSRLSAFFILPFWRHCVSSSLSLHDQPAAGQTCASRVRSKELIAAVDVANSEISKSYSMIFRDGTKMI